MTLSGRWWARVLKNHLENVQRLLSFQGQRETEGQGGTDDHRHLDARDDPRQVAKLRFWSVTLVAVVPVTTFL